jgi:hypothetical protein
MSNGEALQRLAEKPLPTEGWSFGEAAGHVIRTEHFRLFTTIGDPVYQHLLARVLESTHARMAMLNSHTAGSAPKVLDCYVFSSRGQWEAYTRARAGSNAPIN